MNWINLRTETLRAPEYVGSEPASRAAWLNVLAYCCEQENSGRINGARGWKDRQWQQTCGVTLAEVEEARPLLLWDGDDLTVWRYPVEKESEVAAKREGGKRGGKASGQARREPQIEASGEAELEAMVEAELERKGKEGNRNGKESEEKRNGTSTLPAPTAPRATSRPATQTSEDWIDGLKAKDCYKPVNIDIEIQKARTWCETNRRQCTRKFFVNWLNRSLESVRTISAPASVARKLPSLKDIYGDE